VFGTVVAGIVAAAVIGREMGRSVGEQADVINLENHQCQYFNDSFRI